jgi:hypothetical protein
MAADRAVFNVQIMIIGDVKQRMRHLKNVEKNRESKANGRKRHILRRLPYFRTYETAEIQRFMCRN